MKRGRLSALKVFMTVAILVAATAFGFSGMSRVVAAPGDMTVVAVQEVPQSPEKAQRSEEYVVKGGSTSEADLNRESETDDKSAYRTPLRMISVAAVALLLVWYIRRKVKL